MLFLLICFAIFIDSVLYGVVIPIIPAFTRINNIPAYILGLIFALYPATILIFSLPLGILADKRGRKPLILIGMFGLALATVIFALARSASVLFLSRFFQGLAAAATWTAGLAVISDIFPPEKRGEKIGIAMTASGLGLLIGPVIGGVLSEWYGYAFPFYACTFFTLIIGISFIFVKFERGPKEKIASWPIPWRDANLILSCVTIILGIAGLGMLEPLLPLYLMERFLVNKGSVGILFGSIALAYVISQPVFGRLTDLYGRKPFILAGFIATAALCPLITQANSFYLVFIICSLLGISLGLLVTPAMALLTEVFDKRKGASYGISAGVFNIAYSIGLVLGPIFGTVSYEHMGFSRTFIFYAVIMLLIGIAIFNMRIPRRNPGKAVF